MTVPQYSESWKDKAAWAQAKRSASLAKVSPKLVGVPEWDDLPQNSLGLPREILTPREIELTENYTVTELLRILRARDVSVEEVTRAFLRRAALAHAAVRALFLSHVYAYMLMNPDQLSYRTPLGPSHREG
jgi:amidase